MEPLVVRPSRWRFILLTLLMLPFALLGLWMLVDDSWDSRGAGLLFVAMFGGLVVLGLAQAFRSKPLITLSDAGIEDARLKIGVIPWSEVARAYELPYLWQKNVQVLVRHPEQFKQQQPGWLRSVGNMNAAFGWQPFVLVMANTNVSAKTVVDYIYQQLLRQWPVPAEPAATLGGERE